MELLRTHATKLPIPDTPMISLSLLLLLLLLAVPAAGMDGNATREDLKPDGAEEAGDATAAATAAADDDNNGGGDNDGNVNDGDASAGVRSNKQPLGTWTAVRESFDVTDDTNIHSQSPAAAAPSPPPPQSPSAAAAAAAAK